MRFEDFAAHYPREHKATWYRDAERKGVTIEAAQWAHALGVHLHDYLSGAPGRPGAFESTAMIARYTRWNQQHFVETVRAIEAKPGGHEGVRSMHFHTLGHYLHMMWRAMFVDGRLPSVIDRRRSQLLLSLHSAGMIVRRHENLDGAAGPIDPLQEAVLALQHGMLSESDTAITLLEIIRRLPHVIIVPAPPQFESGSPGHNVDLIVIDVRARQVIGIQVKTALKRAERAREYQPQGVVLVDGVTDLANERLVPVRSNSSTKVLKAWPGLISAHFLLRANPRTEVFAPWADRVQEMQRALAGLVYGTSDFLFRAVGQLRNRVLDPLRPVRLVG